MSDYEKSIKRPSDTPAALTDTDISSGDAFALHSKHESSDRFDTFLLGAIDRVNSTDEDWISTFDVQQDLITSPFGHRKAVEAYLNHQFGKLVPLDKLDPRAGEEITSERTTGIDRNTPDRLEDILSYSSNEPPEWLIRRNNGGNIELLTTTPVRDLSSTGATDEYYTVDSHGLVVNFVATELVTLEQVSPDWVKSNTPNGGEK